MQFFTTYLAARQWRLFLEFAWTTLHGRLCHTWDVLCVQHGLARILPLCQKFMYRFSSAITYFQRSLSLRILSYSCAMYCYPYAATHTVTWARMEADSFENLLHILQALQGP